MSTIIAKYPQVSTDIHKLDMAASLIAELCTRKQKEPMTSTEVLLVLNSVLLGVISLLFLGIGYFLKDLHKDFKRMMDRVHQLHNELDTHVTLFENLTKLFQRQIDTLKDRIKRLEKINKV